jgi:chromosome segregation ATPase
MAEKPEKKGILGRISEALYEKVETGEGDGAIAAAAPVPATGEPAAVEQPEENPTGLAVKLRDQIAARGPAFTQFLALVASFSEIITEESGRYRAAMKALEKTGNVGRDQVLFAGKDQLQALESQREVFAEAVSRKRRQLRQGGAEVESIRAKIAELQQEMDALREHEQSLLRAAAAEEASVKAAEESFGSILGGLQDEITSVREKIKKYLV